ncbi:tubulin polyglutamylase complex subunit 2-like [Branchiostoma floridae x Branchiostoma japonicum]
MSEKEELPKVSPKEVFDRLTFGVVKSLEKKKGVLDIHVEERKPAERHLVVSWEQKHSCILPEDVKNFYLTMNGLLMTWKIKFDEVLMRLGRMEINPISDLKKLNSTSPTAGTSNNPSLADIDSDSETDEEGDDTVPVKPHFDSRSRIFELDPCEGTGKVCLVFKNTKPGVPAQGMEIWFLDRALRWNFLTDSFTHYFRMMIMHLGLPQWQYAFTDIGLSHQAKQWFNMYAPGRLAMDMRDRGPEGQDQREADPCSADPSIPTNKLDPARVFKGKKDQKSKSQPKKKPTGQSTARSQVPGTSRPSAQATARTTKT